MPSASQVAFDPASLFANLNRDSGRLRYRTGTVIFAQGDEASTVFYIEQGAVKKSYKSQSGKERIIGILKEKEFFGTGCVAGRTRRRTTAMAVTDCVVLRIEKQLMIDTLYKDPKVAEMFIAFLVDQTRYYEDVLTDHLFHSSEERLAHTLLRLSSLDGEASDQGVLPKISQETLAEIVGTTRSRINFFMNKFRKQGLVEYDGRIRVSRSRLKQMLDEQKNLFPGAD